MKYLFDSTGRHVANLVNGQLHAPTGENIGHLLPDHGIFIDMSGRYLGEIVYNDRLMYKINGRLHTDRPISARMGTTATPAIMEPLGTMGVSVSCRNTAISLRIGSGREVRSAGHPPFIR